MLPFIGLTLSLLLPLDADVSPALSPAAAPQPASTSLEGVVPAGKKVAPQPAERPLGIYETKPL
jgi:hypothetical protein